MTICSPNNKDRNHLADPDDASRSLCGITRTDWNTAFVAADCKRCLKSAAKLAHTAPRTDDRVATTSVVEA
jgi:hypothetical protein